MLSILVLLPKPCNNIVLGNVRAPMLAGPGQGPFLASQARKDFLSGVVRRYHCRPLLSRPHFAPLQDPAFFRQVRVDPGGYGVSWNHEVDLSEYELWTNGRPAS